MTVLYHSMSAQEIKVSISNEDRSLREYRGGVKMEVNLARPRPGKVWFVYGVYLPQRSGFAIVSDENEKTRPLKIRFWEILNEGSSSVGDLEAYVPVLR